MIPKIFVRSSGWNDTLFQNMEKPAPSDPVLLADWLGQEREPAFHALVARYAGLVHATAKRTCGDDSMAAEATQLTFIALAQKRNRQAQGIRWEETCHPLIFRRCRSPRPGAGWRGGRFLTG